MDSSNNLQWQAYEYHHEPKSPDWYWAVGIIAVSVAATAIIFDNLLFAILILLSAFTLAMYAGRHPEVITYEIINKGILINGTLYPFTTLESFWVETTDETPKIIIKSKKLFMPYIIVPIEDVHPDHVQEVLKAKLPEEHMQEPISQKLMERLGF